MCIRDSFPSRDSLRLHRKFIIRDADLHDPAAAEIHDVKLMQMVIEPAHGVLNRHVKIPETVFTRHLDAAPDRWLDASQGYPELEYHTCLLYTSPSPRDRTRSRMPSS